MPFRDVCLALLVTLVWGLNFIATKWAVEGFTPLLANAIRFSIVVLVLFPFLKIVPGKMKAVLLVAVMLGVVHFGAIFTAMQLTDGVGSVAIASQLFVPFSTLLAIVVLKEKVGWKRLLGIALSFLGVLVLGLDPEVFRYWDALAIMSFAALAYSIAAILMRQLKEVRAFTLQAWVGLAGTLGSAALSLLFEANQAAALSAAPTYVWLSVLYSALGSSVAGHGAANYLFRKHEVSAVSPYMLATPLFAVLGGMVVFGEVLTWRVAFGGFLTVAGVLIVTLRNRVKSRELTEITAPSD